jgi:hypothetical protein
MGQGTISIRVELEEIVLWILWHSYEFLQSQVVAGKMGG